MKIQQQDDGRRGRFFYEEAGRQLAIMTYTRQGDGILIIEHTEADDRLKGKGAGKQLVDEAVRQAREKGYKILPLCPFVAHLFDKHPELYSDIDARTESAGY